MLCVWYDNRPQARSQLVLPDGCLDIVWIRGQAPLLAGPATLPVTAELPSAATVLGLRFRAGHAPAYLKASADAVLNANVPLQEVWGDPAQRLADDLEAAPTLASGLAILQTAVANQRAAAADSLVQAALRLLQRSPSSSVGQLGDTLGLSQRQLLRRFSASVGYGPRTFGRVLRFRRFLRLVEDPRCRAWSLARLAVEAGFADHAHLVRDCTDLAGLSPSHLRQVWAA